MLLQHNCEISIFSTIVFLFNSWTDLEHFRSSHPTFRISKKAFNYKTFAGDVLSWGTTTYKLTAFSSLLMIKQKLGPSPPALISSLMCQFYTLLNAIAMMLKGDCESFGQDRRGRGKWNGWVASCHSCFRCFSIWRCVSDNPLSIRYSAGGISA